MTAESSAPGAAAASFLALVTRRERGKLKLYVGMAAGVGKTYRMLQEGHELRRRGVDVVIGFVETHGRAETEAQLGDLEVVPRARTTYRGVTLEEMDLDAVVARRPQVALVDELAHTNVPGSRHAKRWEDVLSLLGEGISVVSAVNVQHLASLGGLLERELGVQVRETVPDWVLAHADQVVTVDLSAEDLRQRLRAGKIYRAEKIDAALANFFTDENLGTLRELALREVAAAVDRAREARADTAGDGLPDARDDALAAPTLTHPTRDGTTARRPSERRAPERVMACLSSDPPLSRELLQRASRIAGRLNTDWYCVYVQTPEERADRIATAVQRQLVANVQYAQELGAEGGTLTATDVAAALADFARARGVTLVILGRSRRPWWHRVLRGSIVERLGEPPAALDVLVVAGDAATGGARPERAAGDR